ncbi:MAG: cell division protein ZapA [Candidatus Korobacteraceae bacterium]|jgi:cell division protein ZapA
MTQSNDSIRVEIYDQSYNLRGSDAEHIRELAQFVDSRMRAVSEHTATIDSLRVAVLAALNIADEYFSLKQKYDAIDTEYTKRASRLGNALDSALDEAMRDGRRAG